MLVSCLCPTYNRASTEQGMKLLEEAVGAFIAQDYQDKELIIGNDTPGQVLRCDHPQVRIINFAQRFSTLGGKLQAMIDEAQGTVLCRWDDDDISLQHRLTMSVEQLGDAVEWRPANYWWFRAGLPDQVEEIHHAGNTHVMALWRYAALNAMMPSGVYPNRTGDEDQAFNLSLQAAGVSPMKNKALPPADIFYVYRWGVSQRHLSGTGGKPAELQLHWDKIGNEDTRQGHFDITPREWQLPSEWVLA